MASTPSMLLPLPTSVAQLPFANRISRLSREESTALNAAVMRQCCNDKELRTHFYDALREPVREESDATGWQQLASYIPDQDLHGDVIAACDLRGWFRLPAEHAAAFLADGGAWTHEVYLIAPDLSWLIGFREPHIYLQGRAAAPMRHQPIPQWTPEQVESALQQGRSEDLECAALAAAVHGEPAWAQDVCVRLSEHPEPRVRGNAVLALGHIARIHGQLDRAAVAPVLLRALGDGSPEVRGQAEAAADDIEHFMQWRLR
jgi:hypothetical protein